MNPNRSKKARLYCDVSIVTRELRLRRNSPQPLGQKLSAEPAAVKIATDHSPTEHGNRRIFLFSRVPAAGDNGACLLFHHEVRTLQVIEISIKIFALNGCKIIGNIAIE
ncbi:MAG: hypothetical protein E6230_12420 [Paenibacillus dendritiformis]|nr:hypothetical protein [Paenibacillus dendritiformis]MDU5142981.1 hypothetical protein [Paenibacillus dendritiformis]NKI19705.1 hypothetical protein [Paenibacillus dendritiformis]NRF98745.1 hypothetical protein [Paenibacillus dendritiformis]